MSDEQSKVIVKHSLFVQIKDRRPIIAGSRLHKGSFHRAWPKELVADNGDLKEEADTAAKKLESYLNAQPRKRK
jgi:hypothetical protein